MEIKSRLEEYHQLREAKSSLKQELEKIDEKLLSTNQELVEYFQDNGLQNLRIDGLGMFYVASTSLPQVEDPDTVTKWLEERDALESVLSFNTRKFQAYYNELLDAGQELPPGVKQFIKTEVRLRR